MLQLSQGLTDDSLSAIEALEREVVAVDGGRLKLEWGVLRGRHGTEVEDILWWDGERLAGFLGIYAFGSPPELAGMVSPGSRRRGVATAMLDGALDICRARGHAEVLLVVPRSSVGGRTLALGRGARIDRSEHAMVLSGDPVGDPADARISLRRAEGRDIDTVERLLTAGFGWTADGVADRLDRDGERTLMVDLDGHPVGTLRVTRNGNEAGIYGFVVDPPVQGRGVGRAVLRGVCGQLRAEGVTSVGLEVGVDNDRALGLYTSIGFATVTTEDYYRLAVG